MAKTLFNVEGMSCSHCENAVKQSVGALSGVYTVEVSLKDKTVSAEYDASKVSAETIKQEIEEQGYEVTAEIRGEIRLGQEPRQWALTLTDVPYSIQFVS